MNKFFATILRAFTPSRSGMPRRPGELRERIRLLREERARLAGMVPYLRDFDFEDVALDHERRIGEIDEEIGRIERELSRAA